MLTNQNAEIVVGDAYQIEVTIPTPADPSQGLNAEGVTLEWAAGPVRKSTGSGISAPTVDTCVVELTKEDTLQFRGYGLIAHALRMTDAQGRPATLLTGSLTIRVTPLS